jgi:hypothetical protein
MVLPAVLAQLLVGERVVFIIHTTPMPFQCHKSPVMVLYDFGRGDAEHTS